MIVYTYKNQNVMWDILAVFLGITLMAAVLKAILWLAPS